jgi:hypothetical protein
MNDESADLRKMLMKRLIEDTEFRKSFVQDPRSALDTLAGAPLPSLSLPRRNLMDPSPSASPRIQMPNCLRPT